MSGAIYNVVKVGENAQTTEAKTHANLAWHAIVDVAGAPIDVILKDESPHRLAKELLAVGLAKHYDVPHITGWAASLDLPQAQAISLSSNIPDPNDPDRRLMFASRLSQGEPIDVSDQLANQHAQSDYWASQHAVPILVFDELVGNYDRQYENVMQENGNFLAFDHDKIFFGDSDGWSQLPAAASRSCLCTVSDDIGCWAGHTKSTAQSLATSWASQPPLPISVFNRIVSYGLLSDADVQAIQEYLLNRLPVLSKSSYSALLAGTVKTRGANRVRIHIRIGVRDPLLRYGPDRWEEPSNEPPGTAPFRQVCAT